MGWEREGVPEEQEDDLFRKNEIFVQKKLLEPKRKIQETT